MPIWAYGKSWMIRPRMTEPSASRRSRPHGRRNLITSSSAAARVDLACGLASGSTWAPRAAGAAPDSAMLVPSSSIRGRVACAIPAWVKPSIVTASVSAGSGFSGAMRVTSVLKAIVSWPGLALAVAIAPRSVQGLPSSHFSPVSAEEVTTMAPGGVGSAEAAAVGRKKIARITSKRDIRFATVWAPSRRGVHRKSFAGRPQGRFTGRSRPYGQGARTRSRRRVRRPARGCGRQAWSAGG